MDTLLQPVQEVVLCQDMNGFFVKHELQMKIEKMEKECFHIVEFLGNLTV